MWARPRISPTDVFTDYGMMAATAQLLLVCASALSFTPACARMEVRHVVTGRGVSEKAVAQAVELSETKYCSVAATLRPGVEIVTSYEIIEDGE